MFGHLVLKVVADDANCPFLSLAQEDGKGKSNLLRRKYSFSLRVKISALNL